MKAVQLAVFAVAVATAQATFDSPGIVATVSPAVVLIKGESSAGTVLGV